MNTLETVRSWLATFPQFDVLSGFQVDFTDKIPCTGGILPDGLVEVSRKRDIVGNVTVTNQYNFGLYYVFEKAPNDDAGAEKTPTGSWTCRNGCRSSPQPVPLRYSGMIPGRSGSPHRTVRYFKRMRKARVPMWCSYLCGLSKNLRGKTNG